MKRHERQIFSLPFQYGLVDRSSAKDGPTSPRNEAGRINFLKQRSGVRIILALVISALCFSLVSMTSQKGASKGRLNKKPSVAFQASTTSITYPCPPDFQSFSHSCPVTADFQVALTAI